MYKKKGYTQGSDEIKKFTCRTNALQAGIYVMPLSPGVVGETFKDKVCFGEKGSQELPPSGMILSGLKSCLRPLVHGTSKFY